MKTRVLLGLLVVMLLLVGCASKPGVRFVWPPPPDEPRLEWKGVFYSEDSFERTGTEKAFHEFIGYKNEIIMQTPFGVAGNGEGRVYVSDTHRKNVYIFDFNNRSIKLLSQMAVFDSPAGMDVDKAGNLYIGDSGKGLVMVFSAENLPLFSFGKDILKRPSYLEIDEKRKRIYVSDGAQHFVGVFDLQGNLLFKIGEQGTLDGFFYSPQGLALSPSGDKLYVADYFNARVQVFTPDGQYVSKFGERGDQVYQFEGPKDLAFDSEGNLHVIDTRKASLISYTPQGKVLLVTGTGAQTTHPMGFSTPKAIFIDQKDQIFVAEALNKRFSMWQYMSKEYLQKKPYTDADKKRLVEHMDKVAEERRQGR